jgi:carbamoyl-phosphate synthase large subunit
MKSTGEVIGVAHELEKAMEKAFIASGMNLPKFGNILITLADQDKLESIELIQKLSQLGFAFYATPGTAKFLKEKNIQVTETAKIGTSSQKGLLELIEKRLVVLVINTMSSDQKPMTDGHIMRRLSVERGIPCLTSIDTAKVLVDLLVHKELSVVSL